MNLKRSSFALSNFIVYPLLFSNRTESYSNCLMLKELMREYENPPCVPLFFHESLFCSTILVPSLNLATSDIPKSCHKFTVRTVLATHPCMWGWLCYQM